jgi:nitroreductase/NAD-dependent dihydropyrimidine dehydrogenase PreA subunit
MSGFVVDHTKCTRDGICVASWPIGIITMNGSTPAWAAGAEQWCVNCGHCVTVCPHGAIALSKMPLDQCPPLRPDWRLTPAQVEPLLKGRRSIRTYKQAGVSREVILQMIDVARFAPSAMNTQPVRWFVIHDRAEVHRLAGLVIDWMRQTITAQAPLAANLNMPGLVTAWEHGHDPICRNAPHLILACAPKEDRRSPTACAIALTYLEIAALPHGVGTCWAGYFQIAATMSSALQAALGLPKEQQSFGTMLVGYPQFAYQRIPARNDAQIMWR